MASLLLHTCCANCGIYCLDYWRKQGHQVTAFWYNPNIHPFMEHQRRIEATKALAQAENIPLIIAEGYGMIDYFRAVVGHGDKRCGDCFRLRLSHTASVAKEKGFDAFTTTLLISPYQKHELLKQVGDEIAKEKGLEFLYQDLRSGFRDSQRRGKELNLYRQQYCGCLYSEWERFGKVVVP